jgi:hypothetical protein
LSGGRLPIEPYLPNRPIALGPFVGFVFFFFSFPCL